MVDCEQRDELRRRVDVMLFDLSKTYASLLVQRKLIKEQVVDVKQTDLAYEKELVNAVADIKKFAAYLDFETTGAIKMTSIGQQNPKYERCVRALADNANRQFFTDRPDNAVGTKYAGLELASVFKIENAPALERFDQLMKQEKKAAVLKGLFIPIQKEQINQLAIFGFEQHQQDLLSAKFGEQCLRIPRQLLKNDQSVVQ